MSYFFNDKPISDYVLLQSKYITNAYYLNISDYGYEGVCGESWNNVGQIIRKDNILDPNKFSSIPGYGKAYTSLPYQYRDSNDNTYKPLPFVDKETLPVLIPETNIDNLSKLPWKISATIAGEGYLRYNSSSGMIEFSTDNSSWTIISKDSNGNNCKCTGCFIIACGAGGGGASGYSRSLTAKSEGGSGGGGGASALIYINLKNLQKVHCIAGKGGAGGDGGTSFWSGDDHGGDSGKNGGSTLIKKVNSDTTESLLIDIPGGSGAIGKDINNSGAGGGTISTSDNLTGAKILKSWNGKEGGKGRSEGATSGNSGYSFDGNNVDSINNISPFLPLSNDVIKIGLGTGWTSYPGIPLGAANHGLGGGGGASRLSVSQNQSPGVGGAGGAADTAVGSAKWNSGQKGGNGIVYILAYCD